MRYLISFLLVLLVCSCGSIKTMTATIKPLKVKSSIAIKRIKFNKNLNIVFSKAVKNNFEISPTHNMKQQFKGFKKTVYYTLKHAFANNFASVKGSSKEKGKGIELVLGKVEVLPTNQIDFQISLLKNGEEVADIYGKTQGRTVAAAGNALGDLDEQYSNMVINLMEGTMKDFGTAVYNGVMRNEKFSISILK